MSTEKYFKKERRNGVKMKYPKILIVIPLLLFLIMFPQLVAEKTVPVNPKTKKQEKKEQSLSAESVDQLVTLIESALKANDFQRLEQIKNKNCDLVRDNKYPVIKKCSTILDEAIKDEVSGKETRSNLNFQVCRVLGEMYSQIASSSYLLDKVFFLQNLNEKKKNYLRANELFDRGEKLRNEYNYKDSVVCYVESISLYREIDYRLGEANCLKRLGDTHLRFSNPKKARQCYKGGILIFQKMKVSLGEAGCLKGLGDANRALSQYEKAQQCYHKALELFRDINDRRGEANCLNSIGYAYKLLSELKEALYRYEDALRIYKEINDRKGEANSILRIGITYLYLSEYKKAQQKLEEALEIFRAVKEQLGEANSLLFLGDVHRMLSNFEEARRLLEKALLIFREINDHMGEASCLSKLGVLYLMLADYNKARQRFQEGLKIYRERNIRLGEANSLKNLGDVHQMLSEYEKAVQRYQEGLIIYQKIKERRGEASCLQSLGTIHYLLSEYEKAKKMYIDALVTARHIKDFQGEVYCLQGLADVCRKLKEFKESLQYYTDCLDIQNRLEDKLGMVYTYFYIGKIYETIKNNKEAECNYKKSAKCIEEIWTQMKVEDFKTQFFAWMNNSYKILVYFLYKQGKFIDALSYAEKSKARSFLHLLGNEKIDPKKGVPPELIKEEEELRQKIITTTIKIKRNEEKEKSKRVSSEKLRRELLELKQKHSEIIEKMKLLSPEYASLKTVNPLHVEEIQALIRQEKGTVLIEYYTAPDALYLWVLDGKKLNAYKININEETLNKVAKEFCTLLAEVQSAGSTLSRKARKLYELLLKPVEKHIRGQSRIAVVPHGVLHYLPFEALMNERKFLVEEGFKFFYLPSASVYKYCREKNLLKKNQLMAIANPDGTLPYSEKEVKEIKKKYRKNARIFIGNDAKESTIKENSSYPDLLHFACHGILDSDHPMYSGLKLTPDTNDDGRLEVNEIFNLKLKPAYLVTLSACETKLGKMYYGDEIVGISRAFIYAGTPSIVASLWKVDDHYTAKFMASFYKALKKNDKIDALNIARKTMIKKYGKRHPFYWAAFILIGDPR